MTGFAYDALEHQVSQGLQQVKDSLFVSIVIDEHFPLLTYTVPYVQLLMCKVLDI